MNNQSTNIYRGPTMCQPRRIQVTNSLPSGVYFLQGRQTTYKPANRIIALLEVRGDEYSNKLEMTRHEREEAHLFFAILGFQSGIKSYILFSIDFSFKNFYLCFLFIPSSFVPLIANCLLLRIDYTISLNYAFLLIISCFLIPENFLSHSLYHKDYIQLFLTL